MAELITLSGNMSYRAHRRRANLRQRSDNMEELMGGFWSSVGKVVTAPVRGIAHAGMEIGRGFSRGEPLRILTAPFKGVGHGFMETVRGAHGISEPFYRPSKMVKWMPLAGPSLTTLSVFLPPPFNVVGLAAGAGLTLAGGVAGRIQSGKMLASAGDAQAQRDAQLKSWAYTGLAVVGGGILLYSVVA